MAAACSHGSTAQPQSQPSTATHLFALTPAGELDDIELTGLGTVAATRRVGPSQPDRTIKDLRASRDGRWIAWSELTDTDPATVLVLLDRTTGRSQPYTGVGWPVAFAPDGALVAANPGAAGFNVIRAGKVAVSVASLPSGEGEAFGPTAQGVLGFGEDAAATSQRLDMIGYDGVVHTVVKLPVLDPGYSGYMGGWLDPAGQTAMVESGDHDDFCGAGPTDTLTFVDLRAQRVTRTLPGPTEVQGLRMQTFQYTGADAGVALWAACVGSDYRPMQLAYRYQAGKWALLRRGAVALAALDRQTMVLQPGTLTPDPRVDGAMKGVPSGNALYLSGGRTVELPLKAVDLLWVS